MSAPEISESTREQRLAFIKDEFRCLHNCEICGKCSFLKGREAEEIYKDYIEGNRSFMEITSGQNHCSVVCGSHGGLHDVYIVEMEKVFER